MRCKGGKGIRTPDFKPKNWKDRVDINGDKEHDSGTDGWE